MRHSIAIVSFWTAHTEKSSGHAENGGALECGQKEISLCVLFFYVFAEFYCSYSRETAVVCVAYHHQEVVVFYSDDGVPGLDVFLQVV